MAEPAKAPSEPAADSESSKSYLDRVTGAGKWLVSLAGAAGSFVVGKFAFDELGRRPTPQPPASKDLGWRYFAHWPGGDLWMLLAVVGFGAGVIAILASVVWVTRSSRVSTAYLLQPGAKRVQQRVQEAIASSTHLYQVPLTGLDGEAEEIVTEWSAAVDRGGVALRDAIQRTAAAAADAYQAALMDFPPPDIPRLVAVARALEPGRDAASDAAGLAAHDGTVRRAYQLLLTSQALAEVLTTAVTDWRFREPLAEARLIFDRVLPPVHATHLASVLEADALRLHRILRRRAPALAPLLGHQADPLEARLTTAAIDLLPALDGAVDRVALTGRVGDELEPPHLTLQDFQNVYSAVIRSGNTRRIRDLKARHAVLLDTAANERTQAVGKSSSKVLVAAVPLTALFAALFVFTVKSSHQIRDDQVTAATESREDALRVRSEASEAEVIATGASAAFLRVPATLSDRDPWSPFAEECGIVVDDDGVKLGSRAVPAVVLSIGAAPATGAVVAARDDGTPDPDAVLRVVTQQTVDCANTFEGWVPAEWVSTIAPEAAAGSAPAGTDATDGSAPDSTDDAGGGEPTTTGG